MSKTYCFVSRALATLLSLALLVPSARADDGPKVGLALGGGGARGLAHIGVLKVLEEVGMPIDAVTGTSIGALVGGLYASGYSAAELEEIALGRDWLEMIIGRETRRTMNAVAKRWDELYLLSFPIQGWGLGLPSGLRSGQRVYDYLSHKTLHVHHIEDFRELPVPFAGVAMNLATGEAVVLDHGDLATAMRASMSIQSVFTPIELDGQLLADGGLARNLPAQDVRNLGADIVIGVEVAAPPKQQEDIRSLVDILDQTVRLGINQNTVEQKKLCDLVLEPRLGEMSLADFGAAAAAIDAGEAAAREVIDQLRALADSVRSLRGAIAPIQMPPVEPVLLARLETNGLSSASHEFVRRDLGLTFPVAVDGPTLAKAVDRLYGTDFFQFIRWRIRTEDGENVLVIDGIEKTKNLARFGLRIDSHDNTTLLFNLTFRNVTGRKSVIQLDGTIGGQPGFTATYFTPAVPIRAVGMALRASHRRPEFDRYDGDTRIARYKAQYSWAELYFGSLYSQTVNAGVGARVEYIDMTPDIGDEVLSQITDRVLPAYARFVVDTHDETIYPTRGLLVDVEASGASDEVGSDSTFARMLVDWRLVVPVSQRFSILQDLYLGRSWESPPLGYNFTMGGVNAPWTFRGRQYVFLGLPHDYRVGPNAQGVALGIQWNVFGDAFVQGRWNAGNTLAEWSWNIGDNRFIHGGGVILGMRLLNARAEISFGTSEVDKFTSHITIGNDF